MNGNLELEQFYVLLNQKQLIYHKSCHHKKSLSVNIIAMIFEVLNELSMPGSTMFRFLMCCWAFLQYPLPVGLATVALIRVAMLCPNTTTPPHTHMHTLLAQVYGRDLFYKTQRKDWIYCAISLGLGIVVIYGLSSIDNFLYYDQSLMLLGILALFVLIMPFLYESPRWLVANGFKEEATAALLFLRGPHFDSAAELNMIFESIKNTPKLTTRLMVKEFSKGNVFVPVLLAVVLAMFVQCGGLNSVIAFSASILQSAEVPAFRQVALYGTGLTRLVVNIFILFFIDLFGRKVLLIVSSIGTFLGTTLLGVHFYVTSPSYCSAVNATNTSLILTEPCNPHLAPLAITGIVVYNVGFSIGWGPAIWLLLGELLPLRIRGVGNGMAMFVMWSSASVVVGTYLSYSDAVQPWFVWWTYSIVNLASLFFVVFCLFESKGKSLEEIQRIFHTKYGNFRLGCK